MPRHVKFTGIKPGTLYYELREFFNKYGQVKYVSYVADSNVALIKFLLPETAAKFLGEGEKREVSEVVFKEEKLVAEAPTEEEVREQLLAKNARKRSNLENRGQGRREGGRHGGGGGGRGRGEGRGGGVGGVVGGEGGDVAEGDVIRCINWRRERGGERAGEEREEEKSPVDPCFVG